MSQSQVVQTPVQTLPKQNSKTPVEYPLQLKIQHLRQQTLQSPTPVTDRERNINMPPTHIPPSTKANTIPPAEKDLEEQVPRAKAAQKPSTR